MIIGITGFIGSGKDTIADYLSTFYGFKRLSFAGALKDAVSNVFGWDRDLLEGLTKESREWREKTDGWWTNRLGMKITPRWILQYWGTEVCRDHFHNDIWIASVENKLRRTSDNFVITDCRFTNELESIKSAGGMTWRVERGVRPDWYEIAYYMNRETDETLRYGMQKELEKLNVHASEYSSVGLKYDHYIDNNRTLEELYKKVDSIINCEVSSTP